MKLGIMQPYFFPYIGYWQLIKAVDNYVVYDDVNYIKGGWINRNNFLINGQKKLFTIQLNGASSYKKINEIEIKDDFSSFKKMLQINYAKAPFYKDCQELVERITSFDSKNLGVFLFNSIKSIAEYLGFETEIILSSEIEKDDNLKGQEKVIHICKLLEADEYYNAIGGQELYSKQGFKENGISLSFLKTNIIPYKQLKNDFVPGLSILDMMMFCSKEQINEMLDNYELI